MNFLKNDDLVRIVSLGSSSDVTQNMRVYHFLPKGREENDCLLIVDCGVGFPEGDMPGVDLIIPDFSYVLKRQNKIAGIILTHGHEDHIGALPLLLPELKTFIPIYAPRLAALLIEEKIKEFGIKRKVKVFKEDDQLRLREFTIDPIRVTHSIPDTFHFFIRTPIGNFYHGSDFKFDLTPFDGKFSNLTKIAQLGKQKIIGLFSDCLGSEHSGYSPSERELAEMFKNHISKARGRVLVTTISSNIHRWQQAIDASRKFGRKLVLVGMSVEKNIKLAMKAGYLNLSDSDLVKLDRIKNYPDNKLTLLVGGSLGQAGSSLDKIVVGRHRISLKPTDKVIFSSPDYVPGTSSGIYQIIDNLAKKGIEVIYSENESNLHVSGHAYQQELALLVNLTKPQWMIPIGGNYRHMRQYVSLIEKMGMDPTRVIIPTENQAIVFNKQGLTKQILKVPTRRVLVDGLGIGDVGQTVLRDRRKLAREGMVVIIYFFNTSTKKLVAEPSIVSRGFVYVKESRQLFKTLREFAKKSFLKNITAFVELRGVRRMIQGEVEERIFKETGRQPMVLPLIIEV